MQSRKKQRRDREAKAVKPRAKPAAKQPIAATRSAKRVEAKPKVPRWKEPPEPPAIPVNFSKVAPDNSYDAPDYIRRGHYVDMPFKCQNCGIEQIWFAAQQKWWYEVAKGGRWTTARLCRACRRRERDRKNEARRVHLEGLARKKIQQVRKER